MAYQPLAAKLRPIDLDSYLGQQHLLAPGQPLREAMEHGQLHSMILWGPPGVGKTSLARLLCSSSDAQFLAISAVLAGVKEIRATIEEAQFNKQHGRKTVLFVDEVHRFNKAQQDAFLPHIEDGTLIFIGATTENPSFELNKALLSRARVYVLKALSAEDIAQLIHRALKSADGRSLSLTDAQIAAMAQAADGDARRALNRLELAYDLANSQGQLSAATFSQLLEGQTLRFDKQGDAFYDHISALHKSVRGSDPNASLYWLARMIESGCDPLYIARRVVRMASEDVGLADPRAHTMAMEAWQALERLGSPEGQLALAQAVTYLAIAPKSNAVYSAWKLAQKAAASHGSLPVPPHLCNAPTQLLKEQGNGVDYHYAHDYPDAFVAGESYFPAELPDMVFYQPVSRGLEIKIAEKVARLQALNQGSEWQRRKPRSSK